MSQHQTFQLNLSFLLPTFKSKIINSPHTAAEEHMVCKLFFPLVQLLYTNRKNEMLHFKPHNNGPLMG